MSATDSQPYEQRVGFKIWDLAIRQQWLISMSPRQYEIFVHGISNALKLCREVNIEQHIRRNSPKSLRQFKFTPDDWKSVQEIIPSVLSVIAAILDSNYWYPSSRKLMPTKQMLYTYIYIFSASVFMLKSYI